MARKMARKINPMPKGYHTATPVLVVHNATTAIDYYTSIFGAKELSRTVAEDGVTILHAELKIGNSIIIVNDEMPAYGILSPISLGGTPTAVQLYLSNVDAVWKRAVKADITVILPLENTYWGERSGKVIDPFGHVWVLSRKTEALSKTEIEKRCKNYFGISETAETTADIERDSDVVVDIETVAIVEATQANDAEIEIGNSALATKH